MVLMSRVTNITRARKPTIVNAHLEKPVGERLWFMYQNRQSIPLLIGDDEDLSLGIRLASCDQTRDENH